jgi:hypothetical protein
MVDMGVAEQLIEVVDEVEDGRVLGLVECLREPQVVEMGIAGMDLAEPIEIAKGDGGQAGFGIQQPGEGVGEGQEGPGLW